MKRIALGGLILLACIATSSSPASAATDNGAGWTLEPASAGGSASRSFFDYSLAPGEALQDYVTLSNSMDHEQTFQLYPADAYITPQGAFALRLRNQPREAVGAWLSVPFTKRSVAARTSITFPIQLGVPRDATPGDWAGGLVAVASNEAGEATNDPATGVRVEQGVAARVYVRVKGPTHPALTLTDVGLASSGGTWAPFASGDVAVSYTVVNSGNVRLTAKATVDIVDIYGRTVATLGPRELPELLPHNSTTVTDRWDGASLLGLRYRARVVLDGPEVHEVGAAVAVWRVSVPLVLMALIAIVGARFAAVGVIALARRWRHRERAAVAT
jgi:hypothetical protein